jgi:hypothetical protein
MNPKLSFDEIWENIRAHKGETFKTLRGLEFNYSMMGVWLVVSRSDFRITKKNIKTAYELMPVDSPEEFPPEIQVPYYVYALLTDPRIHPQ